MFFPYFLSLAEVRPGPSIAVLAIVVYGCAQLVPAHNIRVKPDFIRTGVQAGDSVEINTRDGEYREFVVKDVGTDYIEGPSETIRFSDIQRIVKRSWEEPAYPCGGEVPLGCSIPQVVLILSEPYGEQTKKFHSACVTHDFCYRHGSATYGATHAECDLIFYADMKKACGSMSVANILGAEEFGKCQLAATSTYEAVRRYGEKYFQSTTSTYCDYREDPKPD